MYQKNVENGYIISITAGADRGNITDAEYQQILALLHNAPTAPDGYTYLLREDLSWELVELPPAPDVPEEATTEDLINALREMGVSL